MNAPLSHFLTRFSAGPIAPPPMAVVVEPMLALTAGELEARLAAAAADARAVAEAACGADRAALAEAHAAALVEAIAVSRADWCAGAAGDLAGLVAAAFERLQTDIAAAAAAALRPLLAEAARERALAALTAAIAQLVADPAHPAVTITAPADLATALAACSPHEGVAIVVADTIEASVTCGSTRIETRLAAALADLSGT